LVGSHHKEEYYTDVTVGNVSAETVISNGGTTTQTYTLTYSTVYPASLTGSIYKQLGGSPNIGTDTQIQTFTTSDGSVLSLSDVGSPSPKVSSGSINIATSLVTVTFNGTPASPYYLSVNYSHSSGSGGIDSFVSALFDLPGVMELSIKANRVWFMKSPTYDWDDVLPNVLEVIRLQLGQSSISELSGSGNVVLEDQRRTL
jgi:hypothetical protein